MPPSEPNDQPPAAGPDMNNAPMPPAAAGGDGSVMITMPLDAFKGIYSLVMQLAQGADNLMQTVNQQAKGGETAPMPPAAPKGGAASAPGNPDEDFLNGIAEEGSK